MSRDVWLRRACWAGSVAAVLAAGTLVQAQDILLRKGPAGEGIRKVVVLRQAAGDDDRDVILLRAAAEGGEVRSSHWIGLICDPVDAALRAQLKLKDQGLWVREIVPDAPAAKAGIKVNDILLAVGEAGLSDVRSLVDAVEKSEGKEITIHLLRDGEKQSLKVTPAKRERPARVDELPGEVRRWFDLRKAGTIQADAGGWRAEMLRPGVIGWSKTAAPHKLPKNMTVSITKEGESPAKIVVKQGDKTWETTEDKLKDLPEEVRKHVAPMVRPGAGFFTDKLVVPRVPEVQPFRVEPPRVAADRKLEQQVEDLKQQIEKLQKAVEAMTKKSEP